MEKISLKVIRPINRDIDIDVLARHMPEISNIASNKTRAAILHLLVNTPETMHSMKVEEISFKLGIRQSVIIHHLEKLEEWKLVEVKKNQRYGSKTRRTIWGLDLRYPNWVLECYKNIRNHFYSEKDLKNLTTINKNIRVCS